MLNFRHNYYMITVDFCGFGCCYSYSHYMLQDLILAYNEQYRRTWSFNTLTSFIDDVRHAPYLYCSTLWLIPS